MNKTFTINLNGRVYNINDDAFLVLNQYIESLKTLFSSEEGVNEIMEDIEARIGELFSERMRYGMQVIGIADVNDVIKIMGNPAEIENEEAQELKQDDINGIIEDNSNNINESTSEKEAEAKSTEKQTSKEKKIKRLFRNPDNKVISGVCSGLGAYLNIDPIIIRILFILLFFASYGIAIIAYAALWAIIPEAKNVAQKLQMKGEDPNVENIRQAVNDGELNQPDRQPNNLSVILGFIVKIIAIAAIAFAVVTILPLLFFMIPAIMIFMGIGSVIPNLMENTIGPVGNGIMEFSMKPIFFHNILLSIGALSLCIIPIGCLIHYLLVKSNKATPLSGAVKLTLTIIWVVILIAMIIGLVLGNFIPFF